MQELELVTPHAFTNNGYSTGIYITRSSAFSALFEAFKIFDNSLGANAYWIGTGSGVDWVKIQLGSQIVHRQSLYKYTLYANTIPEATRMVKNWTMEGSNDDSTWFVLDTQTNQTAWGSGEGRTYICSPGSNRKFLYYKINITANNGDATYTQIGEAYLYTHVYYHYLHERRDRLNNLGISTRFV